MTAQELQRLNEVISENRALKAANEELRNTITALTPIQVLRTALTGMVNLYVSLVESGDAGFWDAEADAEVIVARAALAECK
jgi:hypothetical protein